MNLIETDWTACSVRFYHIDQTSSIISVKETCTFSDGDLCGWTVHSILDTYRENMAMPSSSLFHWEAVQINAIQNPTSYMPQRDHTQDSASGWCLLADARPGRKDAESNLITPIIGQTGPQCRLTFWFYLDGVGDSSLGVQIYHNKTEHNNFFIAGTF